MYLVVEFFCLFSVRFVFLVSAIRNEVNLEKYKFVARWGSVIRVSWELAVRVFFFLGW